MISIILAAIIPVAHIWETNSTQTVRRFYTYSASSYKMIPTPNYITDGLTHWWDGQINVGIGWHKDGNIAFWKDLVGSNDLLITSTNVFFMEYGLRCPWQKVEGYSRWDSRTAGVARGSQIPTNECVTIEVCARCMDYYPGASTYPSLRTDMYSVLVSNGLTHRYHSQSDSFPYFVSMLNCPSRSPRFDGGYAYIIGGKSYGGARALFYNSYDDIFYSGMTVCDTFYIAYINSNASEPTSDYVPPYLNAKIDFTKFAKSFEASENTFSESQTTQKGGTLISSELTPNPNYEYFSIGGSCYRTISVIGTVSYHDTNFWQGDIFCVRIYNRELTAAERAANSRIDYERFHNSYR